MIKKLLAKNSVWETLQKTKLPIIIYGTGNGADKIIDEFERLGINISNIVVSDGFYRNRYFRGFKVQRLSDVQSLYPDHLLVFSFAVDNPNVFDDVICVDTLIPVVPVFGNTIFNREYVAANAENLEYSRSLLYDDESKEVFDYMVDFHFTGKAPSLFWAESEKEDALLNILKLTDKEDMLDLGAYRGDTIEELISLTGGYSSVTALEPDPKTFKKLSQYAEGKENITLYPYASWCENKELIFSGGGGRQSCISDKGKYTVEAVSVDSLIKDKRITYVKADVEGAEKETLLGMQNLLKAQKPKLNIACYHRTEDLCTLIPLIHQINPEYKIHLRHHPYIPFWDTNLYCI